jgi:hypothetical protein
MSRTRLLSATSTLPLAWSTAMPVKDVEKVADVPTLSSDSGVRLPATVVTAPPDVAMRRISPLPLSASHSVGGVAESMATPSALLNVAAAPTPSALPELPLPASVLTALLPAAMTRTR